MLSIIRTRRIPSGLQPIPTASPSEIWEWEVSSEALPPPIPTRIGHHLHSLWRRHGHIARRRHLHLTVDSGCKWGPIRVGIGGGNACEETSHSQISEGEAVGIGCKPEGIRRVLIIDSIPRI